MICEHETDWCKNHVHCGTCSYYKTGNLTIKECRTNADRIRSMTDEELANFLDSQCPSCTEFCDDFKGGCFYECPHNHGYDIIFKWLQTEIK